MKFIDWGHIDYPISCIRQEKLVEERIAGILSDDLIIFAEHGPVYTLGRRAREEKMPEVKGVPVYKVSRGGDITYHGPGQLMLYFIFHLSLFDYDVHAMLRWMEGIVITLLGEFGLRGERVCGKTGVFCNSKKIASIGLAFRKWVSSHGLALNINTDLGFFSHIRPCGLDIEMTSVSKELGRRIEIEEVKRLLTRSSRLQFAAHDL